MNDLQHRIKFLQTRLDDLAKNQIDVQGEMQRLQAGINALKSAAFQTEVADQPEPQTQKPTDVPPPETASYVSPFNKKSENSQSGQTPRGQASARPEPPIFTELNQEPAEKSNLEKFIGENLLSKIGIVITVIGVAIGTKYAIDNNLISPWTRIFLGYLFGFGLLAVAMRLREKYQNFSAVLLSGSMAIMFLVTFFAFGLYQLISQPTAFVLMLIFTVFTVYMALLYDRVIIAHFGLVGAYTIPFLLSTGSANYAFLFSYITIINLGILAVSVKKYWKSLFYSAFTISWLIFAGWYVADYRPAEYFSLALTFSLVFFLIFYLTFLAYKSFSGEKFTFVNASLILTNSFIFYGLGYAIIDSKTVSGKYLGLFTVGNALIHFIIGYALAKFQLAHRTGVLLTTALVLIFITIAIPIQFDGNWITLLWTAEAFFLFCLGRVKNVPLYEYFSYPLMVFASLSLLSDWVNSAGQTDRLPIANPDFLTSIIFTAAFAGIHLINQKFKPEIEDSPNRSTPEVLYQFTSYAVPAVFIFAVYNTFRIEIANYFHYQSARTALPVNSPSAPDEDYFIRNRDLNYFNILTQINYTMLFLTILSFFNIHKIRNSILGFVNLAFNAFITLIFITLGFWVLGLLRQSYLLQFSGQTFLQNDYSKIFQPGIFNIGIRYVCLAFFAGLCVLSYQYIRQEFLTKFIPERILIVLFDLGLHFTLLVIVSLELLNLTDIFGFTDSYKLGLSILWGLYALFLIILGISFNKKHLRVAAIVLLAVTLVKLFFYDIAHLDTISKTIVFVSLGILLLIVSFLYNKFKHLIFE